MNLTGFHHHPGGMIYLRDKQKGTVVMTPEEFSTYLGETYVGLPPGCKERIYDPENGINILKTDDDVQIDGGETFKQKGDQYILKHDEIKVAKETADEAVKNQKLAEEAAALEKIK